MRNLTLILILLLAATAFAQGNDVLLTATHDKLNEIVRKALAADPETLKKWSKHVGKDEETKKEFCPQYEKRYLAGFYTALAESKQATGDKARARERKQPGRCICSRACAPPVKKISNSYY